MVTVLARAPALDLSAQLISRLRAGDIRIPPYPAVALALEKLRESSNLPEVASIVATDASLAAAVLREASAASLRSNAQPTLEAAIRKLGFDHLMRIVMASTLGAIARLPGPLALLRRDQWRRSLLAAMFCRELAGRRGVSPDLAFLAGLLCDFGAIAVVACVETLAADSLPMLPEATWRGLVNDLHVEFGMVVAARWSLPEPIEEVIAHHHTPSTCARVHRPLVQLVAVVDDILTILDRGSADGIGALVAVPGLEHDERLRIGALIPKVAEQMASFEPAAKSGATSTVIERTTMVLDGSWSVDFAVTGRNGASYRACALSGNAIGFTSPAALQTGWLCDLHLEAPPEQVTMLANVMSCEAVGTGSFLVIAQPFGLGGDNKTAWLQLVTRTRRSSPDPRKDT